MDKKNNARKLLKQLIKEKGGQEHMEALDSLFLGNDCPDMGPEDCIRCMRPEGMC